MFYESKLVCTWAWTVLLDQTENAGCIEYLLLVHTSMKCYSSEWSRTPLRDINLKCSFTLLSLKLQYLLKYTKSCVHFHRLFSIQSSASHRALALCPHLVNSPIEMFNLKDSSISVWKENTLIYTHHPW